MKTFQKIEGLTSDGRNFCIAWIHEMFMNLLESPGRCDHDLALVMNDETEFLMCLIIIQSVTTYAQLMQGVR